MRCRLWPWNMKKKSQGTLENCVVMTTFAVDDFLQMENYVAMTVDFNLKPSFYTIFQK